MARAVVKFVDSTSTAGQIAQLCAYNVTFYGSDVPEEIAFGPQIELYVSVDPQWNAKRINSVVLSAVAAKAAELGLTVANGDIFNISYQAQRTPILNSALKRLWVQKSPGNVTTLSVIGSAAAPGTSGLASADNGATGQYIAYASVAIAGSSAGLGTGVGAFRLGDTPRMAFVFKTPADITSYRLWVGLFGGLTDADVQAAVAAGFRFSTVAGDTNLMIVTNDAAAQTTQDTGIAVTASTRYEVEVDTSVAGEVTFYVNGLYVGTITTTLPASSALVGPMVQCFTQVAGARSISFSHYGGESL